MDFTNIIKSLEARRERQKKALEATEAHIEALKTLEQRKTTK